jgi:hypothetical protein
MKTCLRTGIMLAAFVGSVGLATAQAPSPPRESPGGQSPSGMMPGTTSQTQKLQLSPAQKTAIFKAVSQEKGKVTQPANFRAAVGAPVPSFIELYTLPDTVVADAPAAKQYKYTMVQNQVVLVDPTSMQVVDIIRQ